MELRCKPGDLAIVVKSNAGNIGKIVRCIRLAAHDELKRDLYSTNHGPCWVIDRKLPGTFWPTIFCPDSFLRPLRGDLTGDTESTETPIRETA